ncbi:hypothetical protein TcasGA2_TC031798 [Tribolium castaneum]|uniref:Uncharacterized protein n=1 Tax=Tribolium castaneum TaxID=7070 RepID=A0A139WAD6_TRICA|nr:hypothetical protein TcasGA2_TC031798 [Tribolium castaneum]
MDSTPFWKFCKDDCKEIMVVLGIVTICVPISLLIVYWLQRFLKNSREDNSQIHQNKHKNEEPQETNKGSRLKFTVEDLQLGKNSYYVFKNFT